MYMTGLEYSEYSDIPEVKIQIILLKSTNNLDKNINLMPS